MHRSPMHQYIDPQLAVRFIVNLQVTANIGSAAS